MKKIFISHQTNDKTVANMLVDFLVNVGVDNDVIFCSSIPGYDVREKIADEIFSALNESMIDIAILSSNYYDSTYCLNEAGIIWFKNKIGNNKVILIGLPEIPPSKMFGFLNSNFKLFDISQVKDVFSIFDAIKERIGIDESMHSVILNSKAEALARNYSTFLKNRGDGAIIYGKLNDLSILSEITTDNEKIVLYYILTNNTRKISISEIKKWALLEEISNVDIESGFDLLATLGNQGKIENDVLELDPDIFRKYSSNSTLVCPELRKTVDNYKSEAVDSFMADWDDLPKFIKLFVSYIIDNKVNTLGARWKVVDQVEKITA